jgi:hypothetical protein
MILLGGGGIKFIAHKYDSMHFFIRTLTNIANIEEYLVSCFDKKLAKNNVKL